MRRVPENRSESGLTFFVTMRLKSPEPIFANPKSADLVVETIQFFRRQGEVEVYGYVVMPDHVHVLLKLLSPLTLSRWLNRFKSYVAHKLGFGTIWQRGCWSEVIDKDHFVRQKLNYIHENPVRARITETAVDYKWSSARACLEDSDSSQIDRWC
jgi:REP element-mobilizing transposase RayT